MLALIMMPCSARNGDYRDASTVRLVLVMVSVATNLRVAAYW
jgi:hypothetical protein